MALGILTIHAGDFTEGKASQYVRGKLLMANDGKKLREKIKVKDNIKEIEEITQENVESLAGSIGAGLVGGALLGPVGLLAGVLAGGKGKEVTFICKLIDGRRFIATTQASTYKQIIADLPKEKKPKSKYEALLGEREAADSQDIREIIKEKPWYKKWWGIFFIAFFSFVFLLFAIGIAVGGNQSKVDLMENGCPADTIKHDLLCIRKSEKTLDARSAADVCVSKGMHLATREQMKLLSKDKALLDGRKYVTRTLGSVAYMYTKDIGGFSIVQHNEAYRGYYLCVYVVE